MPPVRDGELGIDTIDCIMVSHARRVLPQLTMVPVGWAWALLLGQAVRERILDGSSHLQPCRRAVEAGYPVDGLPVRIVVYRQRAHAA